MNSLVAIVLFATLLLVNAHNKENCNFGGRCKNSDGGCCAECAKLMQSDKTMIEKHNAGLPANEHIDVGHESLENCAYCAGVCFENFQGDLSCVIDGGSSNGELGHVPIPQCPTPIPVAPSTPKPGGVVCRNVDGKPVYLDRCGSCGGNNECETPASAANPSGAKPCGRTTNGQLLYIDRCGVCGGMNDCLNMSPSSNNSSATVICNGVPQDGLAEYEAQFVECISRARPGCEDSKLSEGLTPDSPQCQCVPVDMQCLADVTPCVPSDAFVTLCVRNGCSVAQCQSRSNNSETSQSADNFTLSVVMSVVLAMLCSQ